MKKQEKEQARKMRSELGWSIRKIAQHLDVAKSTVSLWVRDIELTVNQKAKLGYRDYNNKTHYKDMRMKYQAKGIEQAKKREYKHIMGCMLYWAEGAKDRNSVRFSNSDLHMHRVFLDFLLSYFDLDIKDISVRVNCYLSNGLTIKDVQEYWETNLQIDKTCWRKAAINIFPVSSKRKRKNKLPYGVLTIMVHRTDVVQNIFGAIQEYGNFNNQSWSD